jgi:hypothetical protein
MGSMTKLVLGSILLVPAIAAAGDNSGPPAGGQAQINVVITDDLGGGRLLARQIVESPPPPLDDTQALAASLYIYLNKNGATLNPGGINNSATNVSTIVPNTRAFPAWNVSTADWNTVRSAVQEMFAPFGVIVSDQPPAAGIRHIEAIFGGTAGDALPPEQVPPPSQGYILGVSPFTPGCDVIEDSIVFTFTEDAVLLGQTPRQIAEIAAQEIAHSFGLDHVLNASDPMTYLNYTGNRSFKSGAVSCGESTPRACGLVTQGFPSCRPDQDSVGLLTARIGVGGGPGGDTLPPNLGISAPQNADVVPPGFRVYATATDDTTVAYVDLYIDGTLVDTVTVEPYTLQAPAGISLGDHEVMVVASDGIQDSSETINVLVEDGADPVDPPGPGGNGNNDDDVVTGGCSTGGSNAGLLLGLTLVGLMFRRRR